ncbi:MAG: MSCRAMM family protein, partial [Eubacterium sp.]
MFLAKAKAWNGTGKEANVTCSLLYDANNPNNQLLITWDYTTSSLRLQKVSSNPSCTNNNPNYSLAGATYQIYNSAKSSVVATLTTKADGTTNYVSLPAGTYYAKETKAPKGFSLNTSWSSAITLTAGETETFKVTDKPVYDPATIIIQKDTRGMQEGTSTSKDNPSLAGTTFIIKYYPVDSVDDISASTLDGQYTLTVPEANTNGTYRVGFYNAYKNYITADIHPTGSDSEGFIYDDGKISLPHGYMTVEEGTPADGYDKGSGWSWNLQTGETEGETATDILVFKLENITATAMFGNVSENSILNKTNNSKYYGLNVTKSDAETAETLSGTTFTVTTNQNITLSDGKTVIKAGELVPIDGETTFTIPSSGMWKSPEDWLQKGSYTITEISAPVGYKLDSDPITLTIDGTDADRTVYTENFENHVKRIKVSLFKTYTSDSDS